jgi:hypothetical protein
MTITATLTQLAVLMATVNPTPEPAPVRVLANPREAVQLADFPCVVMGLAPGETQIISGFGGQFSRHDYKLHIYYFVAGKITPLAEAHARVLPVPQAVANVLFANIQLGGIVDHLGDESGLLTYQVGMIAWGDGEYFGLTFTLPVTEKTGQVITA